MDVDPEIDPIEKESMEKRLGDRIGSLEKKMGLIVESLNRNSLNLDTLYDRLCSDEKNLEKKTVTKKKKARDDQSESEDDEAVNDENNRVNIN